MQIKTFLKSLFLVATIVAATSCAKNHGSADVNGYGDEEVSANGLGEFSRFAGQEAGESYTTKAPHNQRYLFSYDDSTLAPKYLPSLNAQSAYLKEHPGAHVLIAGHTDERGSREYNVALGERRANTVADLMHMAGVNSDQIRTVSYGKERPANLGHDEASHLQNRRVELTYESNR